MTKVFKLSISRYINESQYNCFTNGFKFEQYDHGRYVSLVLEEVFGEISYMIYIVCSQ